MVSLLLAAVAAGLAVAASSEDERQPNSGGRFGAAGRSATMLVAVGDGADGSRAARELADRIRRLRPDGVLYLGDVYPAGTNDDFMQRFAPVYGSFGRRVAPTPGNHDWPNRDRGYLQYWRHAKGAIEPWYAFRTADWEILSLNSEADHADDSQQLRWLRARLSRRDTTCRIAFFHRPRYSAGRHGDQTDVEPLMKALEGHASVVITGHDHNLQRHDPRNGIIQYVSGAGGQERYELNPDYAGLAFADDDRTGALVLALQPGQLRARFIGSDGTVLDRSAVSCRPSA